MPSKNILIVDDDELNREIIYTFLTFREANIDLAVDGLEAVEWVMKKQYDIIIMDLMMPKLDGLSATRVIRALGANNSAYVPIIATTARDPITELAHWQEAGITDYVHKPFSEDDLWEVINTYI
ncbi:MAG: CheY-like chemotaxis protein [Oceanospirillaceae bacterium]|jgi:CheY-like chemotaxis protein